MALTPLSAQTQYRIDIQQNYTPINIRGTQLHLVGEEMSASLPIGFSFTFFDQTYDTLYVSSSGFVSFSPDQFSNGDLYLPSKDSPNNLIAFAWNDLFNPEAGGNIYYSTTGVAPNRKLAILFEQVPLYDYADSITVQLVLFEGSNVIEIQTTSITSWDWQSTMGIENTDGTFAYVIKGRNAQSWDAQNELVRFVPLDPIPDDVGVKSIHLGANCPGTQSLSIVVKNYGAQNLKSFLLDWEINHTAQSPYFWKAPDGFSGILPGDTLTISPGEIAIPVNERGLKLKAWTRSPNGNTDLFTFNDTSNVSIGIGLTGEFTIGPNQADFTDFNTPVHHLNTYGVCGPVRFLVQDGEYNEQVTITEIPGASAQNPVIFQSASQDSTKVIIRYSPIFGWGGTLNLYGTKYVSFNHLTILADGNQYVVAINVSGSNNTFTHNRIIAQPSTDEPYNCYGWLGPSQGLDSTTLRYNHFIGGDGGLEVFGLTNNGTNNKSIIVDNIFENQRYFAILARDLVNPLISHNRIISTVAPENRFKGIVLWNCLNGGQISNNRIQANQQSQGIVLENVGATTNQYLQITNNFISLEGGDGTRGVSMLNASRVYLNFNNINIWSPQLSDAYPVWVANAQSLKLTNNIFSNQSFGAALYFQNQNTNAIEFSDHNDFFTPKGKLWSDGRSAGNLKEWQASYHHDAHSFDVNPGFTNNTDLHVSNWFLNAAGLGNTGIDTDIDEEIRLNPPDIGADEFSPKLLDAGVIAINAPIMPFREGPQKIEVVLQNFGEQTLTQLLVVYQINAQEPVKFNWSGNMATSIRNTVLLPPFLFKPGVTYRIKAWTERPNDQQDVQTSNDSSLIEGLFASLGGDYTIGGINPDFSDLYSAVNALNLGGSIEPTRFLIRPGLYAQTLEISPPRNGDCGQVIFESEDHNSNSVVITNDDGHDYVMRLTGASGLSFRYLTFKPTIYAVPNPLTPDNIHHLAAGPTNPLFWASIIDAHDMNGCIEFFGNVITADNFYYGFTRNSNLVNYQGMGKVDFTKNRFFKGSYGLKIEGGSELNIRSNEFIEQRIGGIHISGMAGNSVVIEHNDITNVNVATTFAFRGISISNCENVSIKILKNKIFLEKSYQEVQEEPDLGMELEGLYAQFGTYLANNMVLLRQKEKARGIRIRRVVSTSLYHNTIQVVGGAQTENCALYIEDAYQPKLFNNIFAQEGAGLSIYASNTALNSDYNCLYSTGSNLGYFGFAVKDLTAWQGASDGDKHSVSVDPLFFGASDLHVRESALDGAGTPIVEIKDDIDGEPRNSLRPDIGADEFEVRYVDLRVVDLVSPKQVCVGSQLDSLSFQVRNSGVGIQSDFLVGYRWDNRPMVIDTIAAGLAPGETITIHFPGLFQVGTDDPHQVVLFVAKTGDFDLSNDTLSVVVPHFPIIGLSVSADTLICARDSINLMASSTQSVDYHWQQGAMTPSIRVSPSVTTIYRITATNTYGCTEIDSIVVSVKQLPLPPTITAEKEVFCSGDSVLLSSSVDADIVWSTGQTTSPIWVNQAGVYYVVYSSENGCSSSGTITIEAYPDPIVPLITAETMSFCAGDSVLLSSSIGSGIRWSTGETTSQIWANSSGVYNVMHTDLNGCKANSVNVSIEVVPLPALSILKPPSVICKGDTVNLKVVGGIEFLWSTGETTAEINVAPQETTTYSVVAKNRLGCTSSKSVRVDVSTDGLVRSPTNLLPLDSSVNLTLPLTFSWLPAQGATFYDLFLWERGKERPDKPTFADLSQIRKVIYDLKLKQDYYWQVLARNHCYSEFSTVQQFILRGMPDLTLDTLIVPLLSTAGQSAEITWRVKNIGNGSTGAKNWTDYIWLSSDEDLRLGDDILLASIPNPTFLYDSESYTQTQLVTFPENLPGNFQLFVISDNQDAYCSPCKPGEPRRSHNSGMEELNEQNNFLSRLITIQPGPTPDLEVDSVFTTTAAFSGDTIQVSYLIRNVGQSDVRKRKWRDRYFISKDSSLLDSEEYIEIAEPTSYLNFPFYASFGIGATSSGHSGGGKVSLTLAAPSFLLPESLLDSSTLLAGSGYRKNVKLVLPGDVYGTFYLHVFADLPNVVYEGPHEFNNLKSVEAPIQITLTPPANLVVQNVKSKGVAFSGKKTTISYEVSNRGFNVPLIKSWKDSIYLSLLDTFVRANAIPIGVRNNPTEIRFIPSGLGSSGDRYILNYLNNYSTSLDVYIPNELSGEYYVFVKTDAENKVFEFDRELDNIGRSATPLLIQRSPYVDLVVTDISVPYDTIHADSSFTVRWTVKNEGDTSTYSNWFDYLYLSKDTILDIHDATIVGKVIQTITLSPDSSYVRSVNLRAPSHLSGPYYLHLFTDAKNNYFEFQSEDNNIGSTRTFGQRKIIFLPQLQEQYVSYCDLAAKHISAPDTARTGNLISVTWSVSNQGPDATTHSFWNDHLIFVKRFFVE